MPFHFVPGRTIITPFPLRPFPEQINFMMNESTALRTLLGDYPNTAALKQGEIHSRLNLDFADVKVPNQAFKRVVRELEFDVAELAIVTYLQAKAYGKPLVLLPAVVGPGRFQHHCIIYNAERGPLDPSKLAGCRVGLRAYPQTTPTWIRGILAEDYGVDLNSIHWVSFEDGHLAEYKDPPGVERAPAGKQLLPMLLAGELDAIILGNETPDDPRLRPLIPEPIAAAQAWCRRHKAVPINHMIVIKESLLREQPELAGELYRALLESKAKAAAPASGATDFAPFGVEANRRSLEIIIGYAYTQGLLAKRLEVDELFDPVTRSLGA
jgi:4,5-dihydroxyphthalate decarboxylase